MKTNNVFVGNIMKISTIDYDKINGNYRFNGKPYLWKIILYRKDDRYIDLETGIVYYKLESIKENENHHWLYVDESSLVSINNMFPLKQEKNYFKSSLVKKYRTAQKI